MNMMLLIAALLLVTNGDVLKASRPAVWSESVDVVLGDDKCVTYKATRQGDMLLIAAHHGKNWHTYALDNQIRVKEKLAGRASLGTEAPTTIEVSGAKTKGQWFQSPPIDLSQPELRWYRWGFEERVLFAIKLDPSRVDGAIKIHIRGQACDQKRCQRVDVDLTVNQSTPSIDVDLAKLQPVKTQSQ